MKRIGAIILICVISISAGALDTSKVVLPQKGSQSLEFGFSGLFNISTYMGNIMALKKFSSPQRATRYAIGITVESYDMMGPGQDIYYNPYPSDSTVLSTTFDRTSIYTNQDISFRMQWLKYLEPQGNLSLLFGVGPLVGYQTSKRETSEEPQEFDYGQSYQTNENVSTTLYLGLVPVVGVEWFVHKNISFHAEYYSDIKVGQKKITDSRSSVSSNGDWTKSDYDIFGLYYSVRGYARGGVSFFFK
ncbi:MAG: hypothetical protein H8E26_12370 [FCB group bacterium]|nr:hypothetical protein [FCB group bacterium]MBL7028297.1 hypothetical protein [Candidatus Neomarinimicrobiota bacterium]MBL7121616.1 hypothetical protein [Candidatus Neomarinimicrobiota bacterium]